MNNYKNIAKAKAIEQGNKNKLVQLFPTLNDESGIYFLTRVDENEIKYAYIGQAKHVLSRLAQHCVGYQHVDLSIKKHGWYSEQNVNGWKVKFANYPLNELDHTEQYFIKKYAEDGFQLRNKTAGGQGNGKVQIDEYRPAKTYRDGLKQGYKNASKEIAHLFALHLNVLTKCDKPNKNAQKALEKFNEFLNYYKEK